MLMISSLVINCLLLKDLGPLDYFLGIEVKSKHDGFLSLFQGKYIGDLLAKNNMLEAKSLPSPKVTWFELSKGGSKLLSNAALYRSVVGALQYATITTPYICFAVNKVQLCQFKTNPLEAHWLAIKRILRSLKDTISWGHRLALFLSLPFLFKPFVMQIGDQKLNNRIS
jgi:histone deacetylase 1/2